MTLVDAPPNTVKQLQEPPELGSLQVDRHAIRRVTVPAPHERLAGRRIQKKVPLAAEPVRVRLVATEQVPDSRLGASCEYDHLLGLVVAADGHSSNCPTCFAADLVGQRLSVGVSGLNH